MIAGKTLGRDFFDRPVNCVARGLIGCVLEYNGVGGVIVETEAYDRTDPACHAFNGETRRNAPLFGPPGFAYVYLSYGIHQLLNFVCEQEGSAAAVLIRALEPTTGIELMRASRKGLSGRHLCSGPGKLTEALGITAAQNRADLTQPPFAIQPPQKELPAVHAGARIGISKGTELPWRYCAEGSAYLSAPTRGVVPAGQ